LETKCLVQQVKVKKIFKLIICKKGLSGFFWGLRLQAATVKPATGLVQLRKPWDQTTEVVVNGSG